MLRFYWLIEGILAGCSLPGGSQPRGENITSGRPTAATLEAASRDLSFLRDRGVGGIISLTEDPLPGELLARYEMDVLHLPIPDLGAPAPDQFSDALRFVDQQRTRDRAVAVHCLMGQGRTGSILAAYLIRGGTNAEAGINRIRALCPGALSSPDQERALAQFATRRDWVL